MQAKCYCGKEERELGCGEGVAKTSVVVEDEAIVTIAETHTGKASQEEVKFRAAEAAMPRLVEKFGDVLEDA